MEKNKDKNKRQLKGIVSSDKMDKTVVVTITRVKKHPKYHKYPNIIRLAASLKFTMAKISIKWEMK